MREWATHPFMEKQILFARIAANATHTQIIRRMITSACYGNDVIKSDIFRNYRSMAVSTELK